MPRRGNTTARGYGAEHQKARAKAIKAMADGTTCHLCGRPMYRTQRLDLDHTTNRTAYRGLAHAYCNRSEGASRGNKSRRYRQQPVTQQARHSRKW